MSKIFNKFVIIALNIILLFLFNNNAFAIESVTSLTCSTTPDTTVHDGLNKTTMTYNCSIVIDRDKNKNIYIGIYATSNTSEKISGNGTQTINITSPESRFLVEGPDQGVGNPVAITTNDTYAGVTMIRSNISTNPEASFSFILYFKAFDADKAGNTFRQHFRIALYRSAVKQNEYPTAPATRYVEYSVPDKVYLTTSNPPTCSIDNAAEAFDPSHYEESDQDIVITVKSNNTWLLEAKLDSIPTESPNGYTVSATQNYFECNSGSGYTCWSGADVKVQYPSAGAGSENYVEVAKDPDQTQGDYTTGSSDGRNLNAVTVTMTEFLKNQATVYLPGTYNATMTFNLTAPR
ncbi:MAG: hypothetical protein AB1782_14725 [Cyanobacteriota bacterium]